MTAGARASRTRRAHAEAILSLCVRGSTRRDLQSNSTLDYQLGVEYRCDCLTVAVDFTRTFTSDRDIKPSDTIFVRLTFKNLGEIGGAAGP